MLRLIWRVGVVAADIYFAVYVFVATYYGLPLPWWVGYPVFLMIVAEFVEDLTRSKVNASQD